MFTQTLSFDINIYQQTNQQQKINKEAYHPMTV